jgi:hypothetical protein
MRRTALLLSGHVAALHMPPLPNDAQARHVDAVGESQGVARAPAPRQCSRPRDTPTLLRCKKKDKNKMRRIASLPLGHIAMLHTPLLPDDAQAQHVDTVGANCLNACVPTPKRRSRPWDMPTLLWHKKKVKINSTHCIVAIGAQRRVARALPKKITINMMHCIDTVGACSCVARAPGPR